MSQTKLIFDRYRLGSLMGQGGMSVVYRGIDNQSSQEVAIKLLKPSLVDGEPELVQRFLREAEALRLLNHPNIIKVLAAGSQDGTYYLVMEQISGGSLRDKLLNEGPLSIDRVLSIGLDLADALTRAHRLNIIHRDIKPENILLAEDGSPRLTDFGIAKLADRHSSDRSHLTQQGTFMGTADYLSPEACNGKSLDEKADIWAFGVLLFEMITGRKPFNGPTISATLTAILNQPMPEIGVLRPGIPERVDRLLRRMLEKKREMRISSARQVGAELELIIEGAAGGAALSGSSMPGILLQTKLTIPPTRSNLVPRPHLTRTLNGAINSKLALVSAPAGFGKTTVLSAWARHSGSAIAWLSLSTDDDEPTQFLQYVIYALAAIVPGVGEGSMALLQAIPPSSIHGALLTLISELSAIPEQLFLILDDYHLIEVQEIHTAMAFLLDHMPDKMHVILSGRSDPPLPLSRLRVRGQLVELRQTDLRFTPEEAAVFLSENVGVQLSSQQIVKLESRTEGWIAGLQLAALSMRGRGDIQVFIDQFSGSHRFVIDYLADEVLSQQPETLRHFLQQTSILDRFTAPLCDEVTGGDDSAVILRKLEETNAFLIPLDDHRRWYRYHQLFRDFLRFQLDRDQVAILTKRASEWLLAHGLEAEGVKLALELGEPAQAARAITLAAPLAFNQGLLNLLSGWLNALPEKAVLESAELAIYKGFVLIFAGTMGKVRPYLEAAEGVLSPESPESMQGRLLSLQAHVALFEGRIDACVRMSKDALEYLHEDETAFRNLTFNVLGQVLELKGDVAAAAEIYDQAFRSGWQRGDRIGALVVLTNLVFSLNELGKRQEAVAWCRRLLQEPVTSSIQGSIIVDVINLSQSLLSYEANELESAQEQAERALERLTAINVSQGVLWAQYILARIYHAKRELDAVRSLVQKGRQLAAEIGRDAVHGAWFAALQAQIDLQQGALAETARWAEGTGYSADTTPHHWVEQPYFTFVRLLLAQEQLTEAQALLERMEASAREGGRARKLITINLLQARTHLSQNDSVAGQERVKRALRLAAAEGYRRAFLDEGAALIPLLSRERETAPAFVDELLAAFTLEQLDTRVDSRTATRTDSRTTPLLVESLTERELDVLRLVSKGLSNREVASALVITLGTVKKHLNNIFGKLAVQSRTQAAIRARELNLLE